MTNGIQRVRQACAWVTTLTSANFTIAEQRQIEEYAQRLINAERGSEAKMRYRVRMASR